MLIGKNTTPCHCVGTVKIVLCSLITSLKSNVKLIQLNRHSASAMSRVRLLKDVQNLRRVWLEYVGRPGSLSGVSGAVGCV